MKILNSMMEKMTNEWDNFVAGLNVDICSELLTEAQEFGLINFFAPPAALHPLNFLKIRLVDGEFDRAGIRLHIWKEGLDICAYEPHDHAWDYVSIVMAGELSMTKFRAEPNEQRGPWKSFLHEYKEFGRSEIQECGYSNLIPVQNFAFRAGQTYTLSSNDIHVAYPSHNKNAISLLFRTPYKKMFSNSYRLVRAQNCAA